MDLLPEEPLAQGWRTESPYDVVAGLVDGLDRPLPVVAVDGRSGSGKSTLAEALAAAWPGAHVVRTDDVAWNESFFGWAELLRTGVLDPVRRGELPVSFRPPAYDAHGRPGAVTVPEGCTLLLLEGVGSARRELADALDATIWVQAGRTTARDRGLARDLALPRGQEGGLPAVVGFWEEWDADETPFLAQDRPWERADLVLDGESGPVAGRLRVARA